MTTMTIMDSKEFKASDNRIIICTVTQEKITMKSGPFIAYYNHTQINELIELHSKIMTEKTLKDIRKFINESREPEQLSLF